jgi:creatinine amidohydrolase
MKTLFAALSLAAVLAFSLAGADADEARVKLENLRHPELKSLGVQVVVLPIGSTEPHANHLPYCTDTLTTEILAGRVAAKANAMGAHVMVLPTMPFGINSNQVPNPYAQSIRPATMIAFVKDVIDTLERQGVRKVVILNGHGGNTTTLGSALRELFASNRNMFVAMVETSTPYVAEVKSIIETAGDHSSEEETSVALALFPQKVRMDLAVKAKDSVLALDSMKVPYIAFMRPWNLVSDNTGVGDPTKATAAKGQKLVDIFLERISRFLKELSDAPLTERFPYR